MKELSIEEKARAYDEALKKARILVGYPTTQPFISDLQDLFPELSESEDEKIRKALIAIITDFESLYLQENYFLSKKDAIAWLEKQKGTEREIEGNSLCNGEQKPVISYDALREGIAHFGITQYQIANWLKKYVDVEKQWEQKPQRMVSAEAKEAMYDKPAWSEEDENNISILKSIVYNDCNAEDASRLITWLKSLKERVQPQLHWKPSEEQIIDLEIVISDFIPTSFREKRVSMENLLEQLKAL